MGEPGLVGKAPEGERLFNGIQVFALQVLDQREEPEVLVGHFADDHRHPVEPRLAGGPPTALAGDDLEPSGPLPGHDRLDQAPGSDRGGQPLEICGRNSGPRLLRIGLQPVHRQFAVSLPGGLRRQQNIETTPEAAALHLQSTSRANSEYAATARERGS